MVDKLTPARRSKNMAAIRSKDMLPELAVRRWLFARGYRYRIHGKGLPGRPDLVFPARKLVIFVHGCFWHQHDDPLCLDGRRPKSRQDYWDEKLSSNIARDQRNRTELENAGWRVLVIWECETKSMDKLGPKLLQSLAETEGSSAPFKQ